MPSLPKMYYTVYLKKDESVVAWGTAKECASMLGWSDATFRSTMCKTNRGERNKYEFVKEKMERVE